MSIFEGWNIFGSKKKPGPSQPPSTGADGTPTVETRQPDEEPPDPAPSTPPPPPAPAPAPTPTVPAPAEVHGALPDRLTVDGEEVDSYVVDMPGDPAQGIPPGQQMVVTQLTPLTMRKGEAGKMVVIVEAEPLEDPADRAKLREAMGESGPNDYFAGSHLLIITSMPVRTPALLISQPTWKSLEGEAHLHIKEKAKDQVRMLLFFPGDAPAKIEITVPFNVVTGEIEEWVFPYFNFQWSSRREHYDGQRNHRRETGRKVVEIA